MDNIEQVTQHMKDTEFTFTEIGIPWIPRQVINKDASLAGHLVKELDDRSGWM